MLDRETAGAQLADGASSGTGVAQAQVIELHSMPVPPTARLGYEEMRTLSRNMHELVESLTASIGEAVTFHTTLKAQLARPGPHALTEAYLRLIEDLQQGIAAALPVKQVLGQMADDIEALLASADGRRAGKAADRSARIQRAIGMTEVLSSMVAKNAAWYAAPGIISATGVSFDDVGQMAALVAKRTALALGLAATTEYPLAVDGQRRYADAGGHLFRLQGYAQAFDQAMALATMFGINKLTGQQAPPAFQVSGYVLSALGAAMQTGALNGVVLRVWRPISTLLRGEVPERAEEAFAPVDTEGLRAALGQGAQDRSIQFQPDGADLEQGLGSVDEGRRPEVGPQVLLGDLPAHHLDRIRTEVEKACNAIANLHGELFALAEEETPRGDPAASAPPASMPVPMRPVPSLAHEAHIDRFRQDIDSIRASALQFRDGLPANDERRRRIDAAFKEARDTQDRMAAMSKESSPKRTAFFAAMGALSVTGSMLGAIGPSVHDEWLSNVNNRAAIFGVTSSVLQAFANLGQFLGGAQPGDGRLARVLKMGMDREDDKMLAWGKNWARSVQFLLGEFPLLQLSTTFSEMAAKEAGRIPQAPAHGAPSAYTIRNVQEAFRSAFNLAFITMALDEKAKWNHWAGLGVSALGAAVPVAVEAAARR